MHGNPPLPRAGYPNRHRAGYRQIHDSVLYNKTRLCAREIAELHDVLRDAGMPATITRNGYEGGPGLLIDCCRVGLGGCR